MCPEGALREVTESSMQFRWFRYCARDNSATWMGRRGELTRRSRTAASVPQPITEFCHAPARAALLAGHAGRCVVLAAGGVRTRQRCGVRAISDAVARLR